MKESVLLFLLFLIKSWNTNHTLTRFLQELKQPVANYYASRTRSRLSCAFGSVYLAGRHDV